MLAIDNKWMPNQRRFLLTQSLPSIPEAFSYRDHRNQHLGLRITFTAMQKLNPYTPNTSTTR